MPAKKSTSTSQINNLKEFLVHELQDLMSVENQILQSLPYLIKQASSSKLVQALKDHLNETKKQVTRLEKIFTLIGEKKKEQHSLGIEGILKEAVELLKEKMNDSIKDAAIISVAQKVEHYEISCYGTARAHAKELAFKEVVELLTETLEEEINADKSLTKLAEGSMLFGGINTLANE